MTVRAQLHEWFLAVVSLSIAVVPAAGQDTSTCSASASLILVPCEGSVLCNAAAIKDGDVVPINFYIRNYCYDDDRNLVAAHLMTHTIMELILSCSDGSCSSVEPGFFEIVPNSWTADEDTPSTFTQEATDACDDASICGNVELETKLTLPESSDLVFIGSIKLQVNLQSSRSNLEKIHFQAHIKHGALTVDDPDCHDIEGGASGSTIVVFEGASTLTTSTVTTTNWVQTSVDENGNIVTLTSSTTSTTSTTTSKSTTTTTTTKVVIMPKGLAPDTYFYEDYMSSFDLPEHAFPMDMVFACDCVLSLTDVEKAVFLQECSAALIDGAECLDVSEHSVKIDYTGGDFVAMAAALTALDISKLDPRRCSAVDTCLNPDAATASPPPRPPRRRRVRVRPSTSTAAAVGPATTTTVGLMGIGWRDLLRQENAVAPAPAPSPSTKCDDRYSVPTTVLLAIAALVGTVLLVSLCFTLFCFIARGRRKAQASKAELGELSRKVAETREKINAKKGELDRIGKEYDKKEDKFYDDKKEINNLKVELVRGPISPRGNERPV